MSPTETFDILGLLSAAVIVPAGAEEKFVRPRAIRPKVIVIKPASGISIPKVFT